MQFGQYHPRTLGLWTYILELHTSSFSIYASLLEDITMHWSTCYETYHLVIICMLHFLSLTIILIILVTRKESKKKTQYWKEKIQVINMVQRRTYIGNLWSKWATFLVFTWFSVLHEKEVYTRNIIEKYKFGRCLRLAYGYDRWSMDRRWSTLVYSFKPNLKA